MESPKLFELLAHPERIRPRARVEHGDGVLRVFFAAGAPRHAEFQFRRLRGADVVATGECADSIDVLAAYVDAEERLHVQWEERFGNRRTELSESVFALATLRTLQAIACCEGAAE